MRKKIEPGKVWLDTDGKRIHAHGGSVFFENGVFYWYGENKEKSVPEAGIWHYGVRMYSSKDLMNWKDEGLILKPVEDRPSPLNPHRIMDRPHIVYNRKTKKYVMWMKFVGSLEQADDWDTGYFGVAVSDNITGPYELKDTFSPNGNISSGDFDMVVDEKSQRAYVIYEKIHTQMIISELTDDYMRTKPEYTSHFFNGTPPFIREAPAFFKRNGKMYLLTSGTTGYFPNPSEIAVSDDYHGEWKVLGDPCVNDINRNSFHAQFSSVFKHPLKKDLYIALGDRWLTDLPEDMPDVERAFEEWFTGKPDPFITAEQLNGMSMQNTSLADYVWLPIKFDGDTPYIEWIDEWSPDDFSDQT